MNIFSTPECGQSVVNRSKIDEFQVLIFVPFWVSFWRCFGSPNGGQGHQRATSKKHKKQMMPKMSPNWSQRGSQNGAKIVKNEVLEASCFKGGSQVASRPPPGSISERFWDHFEIIFVSFSNILLCFLHAFFSNMFQIMMFKITRSHQKNAAESFQEAAYLFVPSCIEKLTSERQRAFRSLLVQVETGQMSAAETAQMSAVEKDRCVVFRQGRALS